MTTHDLVFFKSCSLLLVALLVGACLLGDRRLRKQSLLAFLGLFAGFIAWHLAGSFCRSLIETQSGGCVKSLPSGLQSLGALVLHLHHLLSGWAVMAGGILVALLTLLWREKQLHNPYAFKARSFPQAAKFDCSPPPAPETAHCKACITKSPCAILPTPDG